MRGWTAEQVLISSKAPRTTWNRIRPAMLRGLMARRLEVGKALGKRFFPSPVKLPKDLREMSEERVVTRQVENPRHHELHDAA